VHPLDNVPAIVKNPSDILCIHGAGEMRVAVMPSVSTRCKLISNKILGPRNSRILAGLTIIWGGVASEVWKVIFNLGFSSQNLVSEQPPVNDKTPHALEEVQCFLESVCQIVLPNYHVVTAAGDHEYNRSDICIRGMRVRHSLSETNKKSEQTCSPPKHPIHLLLALVAGPHAFILPQHFWTKDLGILIGRHLLQPQKPSHAIKLTEHDPVCRHEMQIPGVHNIAVAPL
uniref:Uncharacterized protein n=1 Tax=Leptobrachium leishanense TaxID=445787 RepID=A0A8C5QZ92_9ANUR